MKFLVPLLLFLIIGIAGAWEPAPGMQQVTIGSIPVEYVYVYPQGVMHNISQYGLTSSVNLAAVNSWYLLGSKDGVIYDVLDIINNSAFTANIQNLYNPSNTSTNYRFYVFYLTNGFYIHGATLKIDLYDGGEVTVDPPEPPITCTAGIQDFNTSVVSVPAAYVLDNGDNNQVGLASYQVTSENGLVANNSWNMYGSNYPYQEHYVTQQVNQPFTGGVANSYNVNSPLRYQLFPVYLTTGFYLTEWLDWKFVLDCPIPKIIQPQVQPEDPATLAVVAFAIVAPLVFIIGYMMRRRRRRDERD